jgi:hypothetical protein
MHDTVTVDMCVGIRQGCPIDYLITADNQTEFSFGGQLDGFHFAFDAAALRAFLKVGAEALAEMEGQAEQGQTDDQATLALVANGGPSA